MEIAIAIAGIILAVIGLYIALKGPSRKQVEEVQSELHEIKSTLGKLEPYLDGLPNAPPPVKDPFEKGWAAMKNHQ